jgi:hypothetical protein
MKEFSVSLKYIFSGLSPFKRDNSRFVSLSDCHNIEPIKNNYTLHEEVISLNASGYDWENAISIPTELESHIWEDNDLFVWEDLDVNTWTNT